MDPLSYCKFSHFKKKPTIAYTKSNNKNEKIKHRLILKNKKTKPQFMKKSKPDNRYDINNKSPRIQTCIYTYHRNQIIPINLQKNQHQTYSTTPYHSYKYLNQTKTSSIIPNFQHNPEKIHTNR